MLARTNWFFSMLNLHMCSGRPVVADCMRANWSGVCVAVAERQFGLGVKVAGLLHHLAGGRRSGFRAAPRERAGGVLHVAFDEAAVGPADFGQHFAGGEMDDFVDVEALVRFAPAGNRNVQHRVALRAGVYGGISGGSGSRHSKRARASSNSPGLSACRAWKRRQTVWPFAFRLHRGYSASVSRFSFVFPPSERNRGP